jgi:hypothetical protein
MKKMLIIASLLISGFANAESEILPPNLKVWIGYGYSYDSYGIPMICPYWENFDAFTSVAMNSITYICGGNKNNKWKKIEDYHPANKTVYGYKLMIGIDNSKISRVLVYWK